MSLIKKAIKALRKASNPDAEIYPPPTAQQIADAERRLGIQFPPGFLAFLAEAGAYKLDYWETYWVGDESLGEQHIVRANHCEHNEVESPLPPFLVAFHNNGCGDQLCFDTRYPDRKGEYPIVFWDHELSSEENMARPGVVARSFAEWLLEEIRDAT